MRIEIILFLITAAIIANVYTEGKLLKKAFTFKKYYQMAGIALGALFLYYVLKKNPMNARNILATSSDYIKYLPVDKNTSSILSPILDFTSKQDFYGASNRNGVNFPISRSVIQMPGGSGSSQEQNSINRIAQSGKKSTKRSVSETKKKYVAARQNWKCEDCQNQLTAWFEVDHKIRLEYGGSNHIDNLVALCRECHGKKTTIENL
jgi:hypothetical protein